jgi:hydroxymethylpyrimidine/phosphomethylpyrimidine kinase
MRENPPVVLVFAGNDPSGGAGLSADILTLASLGCHALPVVTAITVQDTAGVQDYLAVDAEWVDDQARLLLEDMKVDAIKVGMMASFETLAVIAAIAADYPDIPLILDPVMASGRGDDLASEELVGAMRELLLPHTMIVTPNSQEARQLASDDPDEQDDLPLDLAAQRIIACGCDYVLITGTHENTPQVVNTLYSGVGRGRSDSWQRLPGSYHGSGCTLASALAGMIASGADVDQAVREAQEYTWQSLSKAFRPGMGQFIPDRLFWAQAEEEGKE